MASEQLPAGVRRWLDAAVPLPEAVWLVRRRVSSLGVILVVLAVPFACGVLFAGMDLARGRWSAESSALLPIFLGPFLLALWAHRRRRALARELEAGRRRLGLFLGPDALLLALSEDACTVVPRAALGPVRTERVVVAKSSHLDLVLTFQDGRGGQAGVRVDCGELETGGPVPAFVEQLERWRTSGARTPR